VCSLFEVCVFFFFLYFKRRPSLSMRSEVGVFGVKRPECEVDHSPPSCAEVRNEWSRTCVPARCFYGMDKGSFGLPYSFSKALRRVTIVT
jgi:hypothetical protein